MPTKSREDGWGRPTRSQSPGQRGQGLASVPPRSRGGRRSPAAGRQVGTPGRWTQGPGDKPAGWATQGPKSRPVQWGGPSAWKTHPRASPPRPSPGSRAQPTWLQGLTLSSLGPDSAAPRCLVQGHHGLGQPGPQGTRSPQPGSAHGCGHQGRVHEARVRALGKQSARLPGTQVLVPLARGPHASCPSHVHCEAQTPPPARPGL